MKRSGYQTNPAGQGGVQHSDSAQAPNGLGGSGGLLYSQINSSNPVTAGTETLFNKTVTIAPGTLSTGCYIRYNAWGNYTVAVGTPALTIISRLYNGIGTGIGLLSSLFIAATQNGVSFVNWRIESGLVVHVAGASGNFFAEPGRNFYNSDSTLVIPTVISLSNGLQTPFSVDIAQITFLGMSALWNPSNASNNIVMTGSEVLIDYPTTTS